MSKIIHSKIIKIGNSRGIRIPRAILEQAGLYEAVEMRVEGNQLIIQSAQAPRGGWAVQFEAMAKDEADQLLDANPPTEWDEEEWEW